MTTISYSAADDDLGALDRLAEVIAPNAGPATARLIRTVASIHDIGVSDQIRSSLLATAAAIVGNPVRVVFGGHFSSGKSTVINALLGRSLLPTSDYPETGVPCVITSGKANRVEVMSAGRPVELPFTRDAIAHEVSLVDDDGEYRERIRDIDQVNVELVENAPPDGVEWIDSPGINDSDSSTALARAVADYADVLVWVINSRQPLSEVEQAFLGGHAETHGPDSVVFVVNVFLDADTPDELDRYLARREGYFRNRLSERLDDVLDTTRPLVLSARGAIDDFDGFGAAELRAELRSMWDESHPRVRATRAYRTVCKLRTLTDQLDTRIAAERSAAADAEKKRTAFLDRVEKQRSAFHKDLRSSTKYALATHDASVRGLGAMVSGTMATGVLRRDDHYGLELVRLFTDSANDLAGKLVAAVDECARRNGHSTITPNAEAKLRGLLAPSPITVTVPNTPPKKSGSGWGALVGGIVGTIVLPGAGTAAGAALGAAVGSSSGENQRIVEQDRTTARKRVVEAGTAAAVELTGKAAVVEKIVLDACRPLENPPGLRNPKRVECLVDIRAHIVDTLEAAADDTWQSASQELQWS